MNRRLKLQSKQKAKKITQTKQKKLRIPKKEFKLWPSKYNYYQTRAQRMKNSYLKAGNVLDAFHEVVTLINKFSVEARTSIRKEFLEDAFVCVDNYVVGSFNPESWQNISFRLSIKDVQHKNLVEKQIITKYT